VDVAVSNGFTPPLIDIELWRAEERVSHGSLLADDDPDPTKVRGATEDRIDVSRAM
jgi:hypothetical protein